MKNLAKEWFKYLTDEEQYNIEQLIKSSYSDKSNYTYKSLSEAITEVGTWAEVPFSSLKITEINNCNSSQVYFERIYNKYYLLSDEEVINLNKKNIKLNKLVKQILYEKN